MNKVENAIILAAGKGERMLPLTASTPKPLIPVCGKPIIENTIEILLAKGIRDIYVVVGYLAEQFQYLTEKYPVKLLLNKRYAVSNNITSLYTAAEYLGNSLILDADIWIEHPDIIKAEFEYSGYTGIWTDTYSDEWIQYVDENDFLIRCTRGGENGWCLYSISYWTKQDCDKLRQDMETEIVKNGNTNIYWDDIPIFCYPQHYRLQVKKSDTGFFYEFDSIKELAAFDAAYKKYIG